MKKKTILKKNKYALIFLSLLLFIQVGCSRTNAKGGRRLNMNITVSETTTWYSCAAEFAKIVEEKTDGKYTVSIFANEQLSSGNQQKGVEMIFTGVSDVDLHSTIIMSSFDQRFSMPTMPFLFSDYEEADKVLHSKVSPAREKLFELVESKGSVPLALGESGFRQMTNNVRPIKNVEDLHGIKMRVPGMKMYIELFRVLGSDPTSMAWSEVFTSLQQGAIDGQENPLDIIDSAKIPEVQKYLTINNYSYDPLIFSISRKVWEGLTEEEKVIFKEAAEIACANQIKDNRAKEKEILDKYGKENKIETHIATEEEKVLFKEKAKPVYDLYRNIIGQDWYDVFGYKD